VKYNQPLFLNKPTKDVTVRRIVLELVIQQTIFWNANYYSTWYRCSWFI